MFKIYAKQSEPTEHPGLTQNALDLGMDLANELKVAFDSKDNLVEKLKSPFPCSLTGSYAESLHQDFRIPPCYKLSKPKELKEEMI